MGSVQAGRFVDAVRAVQHLGTDYHRGEKELSLGVRARRFLRWLGERRCQLDEKGRSLDRITHRGLLVEGRGRGCADSRRGRALHRFVGGRTSMGVL